MRITYCRATYSCVNDNRDGSDIEDLAIAALAIEPGICEKRQGISVKPESLGMSKPS